MRYWIFIILGFIVGLVIGIAVYLKLRGEKEETRPPRSKYLTLTGENNAEVPGFKGKAPVAQPADSPETAADRLEAIRGIGPVYARRLKEAGVRTFKDLADLSGDRLAEIIGSRAVNADFESWQEQARVLAF